MPQLANGLGLSRARFSGGGFVGPLDNYTTGIAGSWSVMRRLLTSYTGPIIRVRRSGDDAEADFSAGADGWIDTTALVAWVVAGGGTENGFVTTIYGQALGRHFVQTTAAAQRQIVSGGSLITLNGYPALQATGLAQGYATATFTTYTGTLLSLFTSCSMANSQANARLLTLSLDANSDFAVDGMIALTRQGSNATISTSINDGSTLQINEIGFTYDDHMVLSTICDGTNNTLRRAATTVAAGMTHDMNVNRFLLSSYSAANPYSGNGDKWSEAVAYFADKTSDDAALRAILTP